MVIADTFSIGVTINAEPTKVWKVLTSPGVMTQWMAEPEMKIEVETNWKINAPIFIRGFHHLQFENRGVVLEYDKEKKLSYTHLSSLSRLEDKPGNYSVLEFILTPVDKQTLLALNITNFPTDTIRKHLEFYWRTTIVRIKKQAEIDSG